MHCHHLYWYLHFHSYTLHSRTPVQGNDKNILHIKIFVITRGNLYKLIKLGLLQYFIVNHDSLYQGLRV